MSLMGLDIGTTGTKAVVFSEAGEILATAYKSYPEIYVQPGWVEMDPSAMWAAIQHVIQQSAANAAGDPVRAIGIAALGEAVTPIDASHQVLFNTIPSVDNRCTAQVEDWKRGYSLYKLYQLTGQPLHPSYSIHKIMWLRDQQPEIFEKTWKFLMWEDLCALWLGVEPGIDYSLASRTMVFNIHDQQWSDELLGYAQVPVEKLAKPVLAGTSLGRIGKKQADLLGIPPDAVITVAGHDAINGAVGAAATQAGQAVLTVGTTESIVVTMDEPILSQKMLDGMHPCYCHALKGKYAALAFSYCSGNLLRWYRDLFCGKEQEEAKRSGKDIYDIIVDQAHLETNNLFLLPHFIGSGTPYLDAKSKGVLLGLTLATTPQDITAAILEGTTFELMVNMESLEISGVQIGHFRAVGGGAKSDRWLQLKADITGKEIIQLNVTESGCLGAAIQAGVACGIYTESGSTAKELVKEGKKFHPDPAKTRFYKEKFEIYKEIYPAIKTINRRIDDFSNQDAK